MQEKQDKQSLTLKCLFTEEEKTQMAKEMAQKTLEKDTIQQTMKETQAQFKAKIEACETIIKRNATYIKDGYEYRSVDCVVDYNTPERGKKTITRTDTGETFIEDMTRDEKANLFFNVDAPKDEKKDSEDEKSDESDEADEDKNDDSQKEDENNA